MCDEPWDTKLARSAKPNNLIQLACYADMLAEMQGLLPQHMHLVLGDKSHHSYRTEDYIYYFRELRKGFLKQQARLQIESRGLEKPRYELISPQASGKGLTALPPPSPLDVYYDMEGYPLTDGGLEYLFGATVLGNPNDASTQTAGSTSNMTFLDWWAHDSQQEKLAFEKFVDWAYARWQQDPTMHIYHYAPYELTALRKLMNKYATREKEVDDLLRHEVMVRDSIPPQVMARK